LEKTRVEALAHKNVVCPLLFATFGEFRNAITDCLNQTHTTYKTELDSLLTLRFQVFKKCEVVPIEPAHKWKNACARTRNGSLESRRYLDVGSIRDNNHADRREMERIFPQSPIIGQTSP